MTHRFIWILALILAACSDAAGQETVLQATVPQAQETAPLYTATFTATDIPTGTHTPSPAASAVPASTTPTSTPQPTATRTPPPVPTVPIQTLTPLAAAAMPTAYAHPTVAFSTPADWSCGDFPCEGDIDGFLQRIRVPRGYTVSHVGQFPGQPMQITYGPDERLYATVLENGTRVGAVYAMNPDGSSERYSGQFTSPLGLAFQPGTAALYVSARLTLEQGGGIWRLNPDGSVDIVVENLPCCFQVIDNQPNGMVFGPDGYLYIGVGSLTDHAEPENPDFQQYAELNPFEASILRVNPHTGEYTVFASGIRNPYDLTFDSTGQFYATDNGLLTGPGDRLLAVEPGGHYGWPFWRLRGCEECPLRDGRVNILPDLVLFPDYTLPRGLVAYTGNQFPENIFDSVFVALWHNTLNAQRVVRIDPDTIPTDPEALRDYVPEPFITGLIRPVDVTIAPDGTLVVADFIYGHIWRVTFTGEPTETATPTPSNTPTITPTPIPSSTPRTSPTPAATATNSLFNTATPIP